MVQLQPVQHTVLLTWADAPISNCIDTDRGVGRSSRPRHCLRLRGPARECARMRIHAGAEETMAVQQRLRTTAPSPHLRCASSMLETTGCLHQQAKPLNTPGSLPLPQPAPASPAESVTKPQGPQSPEPSESSTAHPFCALPASD